jgi:imidazolonepropionase-like amidohydrolase
MRRALVLGLAALLLAGCANSGASQVKVIVGATLRSGGVEVPDSVVVVAGKRIRAVGARRDTPIPQDSERVDGTGMVVKAEAPVVAIAVGQPADLVLVDGGGKVTRRMRDGAWVESPKD